MSYVETLLGYKVWANDLLFSALADLPATELVSPQPIVFGSILRTLNHVFAMDRVWQAHLLGEVHEFSTRDPDHCPDFPILRADQHRMDEWFVEYGRSLSEKRLADVIEFAFIGGEKGAMTRSDILLHVVNHATYHRGHIADMMYRISAQPPTTDLSVFLTSNGA